jgi:L-ascorbate 6-phosphate lactonase
MSPALSPELTSELEEKIPLALNQNLGVSVIHLGQMGILLQRAGVAIAIDPYLTDSCDGGIEFPKGYWSRNYPPPIAPEQLTAIDLVLCTHDHGDHLDIETVTAIAKASPQCRFAGPRACVRLMQTAGISAHRTVVLNPPQPLFFHPVEIVPVAAAHEEYETDDMGCHRFLGYILRWGHLTFYHSGDTIVTPQLSGTLTRCPIDVAFLPVNGRDEFRRRKNIIGNMTAAEALALADSQNFGVLVPMHYDLFRNNSIPISEFVDQARQQYPDVKYRIMQPGAEWLLVQK